MRIFFAFILSALIGLTSIQAQTKTYDIKYSQNTEDDPSVYVDFLQISPTRIIATAGAPYGYTIFVILNTDGMIEYKWKSPFITGSSGFYRYDYQSNTIVFLITENISNSTSTEQLHLVLLDSNLVMKSNVILDSTVTGIPTVFDKNHIKFKGITLRDSSLLWMSYKYDNTETKPQEQIALHISKDGRIINKTSLFDTSRYIVHYPLFQMQSGKILYRTSTYFPKKTYPVNSLQTSDTSFQFILQPSIDSLNESTNANFISTKDTGIALAFYRGSMATVIKYDKNFEKKWTANVPAGDANRSLYLIESRNGGYYIATSGYDSEYIASHPEFKDYPECFEDIILSRIDPSGNIVFSAYYGTGMCNEQPYGMMEDYTDGGIIISGSYNMPKNNSPCESLCQDMDINWLFKVDSLGEPAKRIAVTGIEEKTGNANNVRIFPNPASGTLTVDFGRTGYFTTLEIVDISGRVFQTTPLENKITTVNVDISNLASGNYFCRLRTPSYFIARPFIIQR